MKIPTNFLMSEYEFEQFLKHLYKEKSIPAEDLSAAIKEVEEKISSNEELGKKYTKQFNTGDLTGLSCIYLLNKISYENYRYEKLLNVLNHHLNKLPKTTTNVGVGS